MDPRERNRHVSKRVYRLLLAAYPKEFRREYGARMEQTFGDLYRERVNEGGYIGLTGLWARTLLDLASTSMVQRIEERRISSSGVVEVNERKLAGVGLVLLAAPLFFVAGSLLKYELGIGLLFDPVEALLAEPGRRYVFDLISPVIFLGGLFLALALNASAILRLNVGREGGAIVGTARVEIRLWNIAVVVVSLLLLATLVGYLFAENFVYRP